MKKIEAAEKGLAQANSYYLLMWAVTTIVGLTVYIEYRAISKDKQAAASVIEYYKPVIGPAERVAIALRTALYRLPRGADEEKSLSIIREKYLETLGILKVVSKYIATNPNLSLDNRIELNVRVNWLIAMQYYNAGEPQTGTGQLYAEEPALLLSEFPLGTLAVAKTVDDLRIEDAARLLWLGSLPNAEIAAASSRLLQLTKDNSGGDEITALLVGIIDQKRGLSDRKIAEELWTTWLTSAKYDGTGPADRLAHFTHRDMPLSEPYRSTLEAYRKQIAIASREKGDLTNVKLPMVDVQVALADAVLVLPGLLAACLLAILIYMKRSLRYAEMENLEPREIVGGVPVFYAGYGLPAYTGYIMSSVLLSLPTMIAFFMPLLASGVFSPSWSGILYGSGLVLEVFLIVLIGMESRRVFALMDAGVVAKRPD